MSRTVTPALPEEIYVHIFSYIDPADLWLSTRLASKTFNRIIESHLQLSILPFFQISISYNLGGARWYDDTRCFKPFFFYPTMLRTYYIPRYDVRTRVFLSYNALDQSRPQYALFDKFEIHPEPYHGRALEKWKRIAEEGVDPETKWMVQLRMGNPRLCDMQNVKLSRTILLAEGALCDWKELFSAYFRASAASVAPVTGGVTELTPLSSLHAAAISYVRGTS